MYRELTGVLSRIPYAYPLGRKVIRTYRRYTGPTALYQAVKHDPIRLVIGASGVCERGWARSEVEYLNITKEEDWRRFFQPESIAAMLAEHVWEHLVPADAFQGATLCYKYLKRGGHLRVAVPDGLHPHPSYIQHVKPGGTGPGAYDHKVLYTYQTLSEPFQSAGFSVELLEYYDERGYFHFNEWNRADGFIHRSSRFDERNVNGNLTYTSIILDARKLDS
jgi:predicted SAM-dependent methyltransferase